MILPPLVVVVLNHASRPKLIGPAMELVVDANPLLEPLNDDALRASPRIAPLAPRVTPLLTVRSDAPAQSYDSVADESSRGQ